ncbi:hypothetical protein B7755_009620 [Streptomyces sp. NBS 14/10]|uniref:hypothetical protein n=1 Tax=Streptomyces sp. NBS 14/10 TaxID=1945643 RepID=UPI000B7E0275|nr:hypothetical protein [Streptomyces sp. NBS 14/10]KAK1178372.1 hypothetical protein B7755_009620 [Streptomyces sp. NBS 14/10]
MPGDRPTLPPVRLRSEAELARDALSAPLLARAVRLARWAGPQRPVAAGGVLTEPDLRAAAEHLGLGTDEDGPGYAAEAWQLAVDTGLIEVQEPAPAAEAAAADGDADEDGATGIATPGEELRLITEGSPRDVLDIWLGGFETVLADAAAPDLAEIVDQIGDDGEIDLDEIDWNPEEEAEFLDGVLGNLYLLTALDEEDAGRAVPLPALAAAMIVPEDMEEPTDDILEEISEAMVRLDDQFRMLEPTGLVEYQPVDEALIEEVDGEGRFPETAGSPLGSDPLGPDEDDVSRYGMVRLTPLGVFGVRNRMLDAGIDAPAVGDLADKGAEVLLDALPGHPETAARAEAEQWLARRTPDAAARELLAAARGDDTSAPLRRLACQQTLSLVGGAAEPALREVLDDRHLGGLARVWLAEHAMPDVPEPSEEMVFWLTVDTIAAQLAAEGDSAELRELVRGLVEQSGSFFDSAWRVDHPATAEVLEAMGRLHPDKKTAKEARKAAFKARSRA